MIRKKTWFFSLLVGVLSFILVRIWQQRKTVMLQRPATGPEQIILIEDRNQETQVAEAQTSVEVSVDDLKKIEGIGPKIANLLRESGISTYEQLSKTDMPVLEQILMNANLRFAKPTTWPEQASYAVKGDWEGLHIFQSQLKGGVRK